MNSPSKITACLREAGMRPTRQRVALAALLFDKDDHHHVTAEQLHQLALALPMDISLATVYNTLHQFTKAGLLRQVVIEHGQYYFDTNTGDHHHFYHTETGRLEDIPADGVAISALPTAPDGARIARVDVIVRLENTAQKP